jgi:uncharacterized membrane protein
MKIHLGRGTLWRALIIFVTALVLGGWLYFTPPGLLGKADAVGYAVCHRIPARSFKIGDRQTPLCARCSGMYLGAFTAFLYQVRYGKRGGMPSRKFYVVLAIFLVAFGIDGVNSYLHFFPNAPGIYQPQNWLRLITGTGLGFGMAAMLYPTFNQTIWSDWLPEKVLSSWSQLSTMIAFLILMDVAVLIDVPILLYPLALISSATVLAILTAIYTIVLTLITKRDNHIHNINELAPLLIAGFGIAILQIGVMNLGRFILTGTWEGFPIG